MRMRGARLTCPPSVRPTVAEPMKMIHIFGDLNKERQEMQNDERMGLWLVARWPFQHACFVLHYRIASLLCMQAGMRLGMRA